MMPPLDQLNALSDCFARRHIGPDDAARAEMLAAIGVDSLDHLVAAVLPAALQTPPLDLPPALDEAGVLADLQALASQNRADI